MNYPQLHEGVVPEVEPFLGHLPVDKNAAIPQFYVHRNPHTLDPVKFIVQTVLAWPLPLPLNWQQIFSPILTSHLSDLQKQTVTVTEVIIKDIKLYGVPHKRVQLALKGGLPFGVAGALAHPTYVRHPVLPKVAHLHLSLLYSSTMDQDTGCAPPYQCALLWNR